ncbi:MAG: hypothetical protein KKF54_03790 [Candidatus Omnitrophica bacterium]|nr:hypothetical protein [Candidatus Omnitrophota bacterium]
MKKKVYKLKDEYFKCEIPINDSSKALYDFKTYINKRKLQNALDARNKLIKKYNKPKRVNSWVLIFSLLAGYYLLVGFIILLSKLGI